MAEPRRLLSLCAELGLPIASANQDGPTTMITFLGIEIDLVTQELMLPQQKLAGIQDTIRQ